MEAIRKDVTHHGIRVCNQGGCMPTDDEEEGRFGALEDAIEKGLYPEEEKEEGKEEKDV
jgi:hypothetical protein